MKKSTTIYIILLWSAAFFFSAPCSGICSPTYTLTEDEMSTLLHNLNELEQNNKEWETLLNESGLELTQALTALSASKKEIQKLKDQLTQLKNDSNQLEISLKKANEELATASAYYKEQMKERDRVENRLRNQRNFFEILCACLAGIAISQR